MAAGPSTKLLDPTTAPEPAADSASAIAPVLELRSVVRSFGPVQAVDGVSLSVKPGEVFTLLGPSGCGKSTPLRLVAGLEEPTRGEIYLAGSLVASGERGISLAPERRTLGMVFQSYAIWPHMTVFENVAVPLTLRRLPKAETRERVERTLDLVGLAGYGSRPATNLSGGQQQRVALARAVVYEPRLLLLDEPLSNLDAKLREHMRLELRALQQRLGIAVLFVTHDQAEAMVMSDRIAVMQAGRVEQIGSPVELYERPATPFVRDFLGRVVTFDVVPAAGLDPRHVEVIGENGAFLDLPQALDSSGRTVVACRPEDMHISASDGAEPNQLRAVIETVAYLGERVEYSVRTAGGRSFLVFSTRRERRQVGETVSLRIDTADATVWSV